MPLSGYFKGKGSQIMDAMRRRYGPEKGKRVFYATAQKTGQKPSTKARGYAKLREKL